MLNDLGLFQGLTTRIQWLSERQKLIARNLSLADVPGEKTVDLKPLSFQEMMQGKSAAVMAPTQTNPKHIAPQVEAGGAFGTTKSGGFEVSPNGNAIDLEQQLLQQNENTAAYNTALNLYRKNIAMLRTAIGKPT